MIATLVRTKECSDGTFGVLELNGFSFYSLERAPDVKVHPRIPVGEYELVPHSGSKYKNVLALVNKSLGIYHGNAKAAKRFAILIHPANFMTQLRGCIALGDRIAPLVVNFSSARQIKKLAVLHSVKTCQKFFELERELKMSSKKSSNTILRISEDFES